MRIRKLMLISLDHLVFKYKIKHYVGAHTQYLYNGVSRLYIETSKIKSIYTSYCDHYSIMKVQTSTHTCTWTLVCSLYLFLLEELHIRESSDNILSDHLLQVIVLEELIPGTLRERERKKGWGKRMNRVQGHQTHLSETWNIHLQPVREDC